MPAGQGEGYKGALIQKYSPYEGYYLEMSTGYFHRVTRETPTRFWINNPSESEIDLAIEAGAVSCTTNPTYCAKLLKVEPDFITPLIDHAIVESTNDDTAADSVCMEATKRLINRFLPLYEKSGGTQGFVTIQSDPRKDEDADEIISASLRYRALGPNFMTKIPVTAAGLKAIRTLAAESLPLCATEVFSIDQTIALCELCKEVAQKTGCHPPVYVTHITGIFDEYLAKLVSGEGIEIPAETLEWAGSAVGRKEYRLLQKRGYAATMLGGGARTTRHFTDFVGGDVHITINWSAAQELIEADPPVVSRIGVETPAHVLQTLLDTLPDFRTAYEEGAMPVEAFADYGPVQLFRNNFIAGYERLLSEIAVCRKAQTNSA